MQTNEHMIYGIAIQSILPVRKAPSEQSEMMTQALFGEHFEVIKKETKWSFIKMAYDQYEGWIDNKMYEEITQDYYNKLSSNKHFITKEIVNNITLNSGKEIMILSCGSILPFINKMGQFSINNKIYKFTGDISDLAKINICNQLIEFSKRYLNTPYLWGGKSSFGIDCSGLTQIVYKIHDIYIPRDACQQAEEGKLISFNKMLAGDLAFFENSSGKITHVGIVMENNQIIHASGKVRIDMIDTKGIFNSESNTHTHKLSFIKRYIF